MARDKCQFDYCWDKFEYIYKPVEGRKIGIWPKNECVSVEFLKLLKDKYGFSILLSNETFLLKQAFDAGWDKSDISIRSSGNFLGNAHYAEELWLNWSKEKILKEWYNKNCPPPLPPCDPPPGYPDSPPFIDWVRELNPPFHSINIDEPWKTTLVSPTGLIQKLNQPYIPEKPLERLELILRSFGWYDDSKLPRDIFCNLSTEKLKYLWEAITSKYTNTAGQQFPASEWYADRFWLVSFYYHECMDTKLTINAYNSMWNNWWRDFSNINANPYEIPNSNWNEWIDEIYDDGYFYTDWYDFMESVGNARGGWIDLMDLDDIEDAYEKIDYAKNTKMSTIWVFPGVEDDISDMSCAEWMKYLERFVVAAHRHGYLTQERIYKGRECISYEIPGCREGSTLKPDPAFYPLDIKSIDFP